MIFLHFVILFFLAIYSYTQVDLNLTFFQNTWYLSIQNLLTNIGYYQRPLSTLLFASLLTFLFINYIYWLKKADRSLVSSKLLIKLILPICILGLLSYPALSHDFFNYLFDARIVTKYGMNPYTFKALDFPNDAWIRFMHWTHRTFPYGPLWLAMTIVPSIVGFGKFVFTVFLYKLMFVLSYLTSIYLIYISAKNDRNTNCIKQVILFALNPLVIIEGLVSPHIDLVMTLFILVGFTLLFRGSIKKSVVGFVLGALVKFLPVIFLVNVFLKNKISKNANINVAYIIFCVSLIPIIIQREFYPWYFLPLVALVALYNKKNRISPFTFIFSSIILLTYLPYIFFGEYTDLVWNLKIYIVGIGFAVSLFYAILAV